MMRLVLGEMADSLLTGQRVIPQKLWTRGSSSNSPLSPRPWPIS